ncbi:hypothetical protein RUND412_011051 [Rhizina undulata]
MADKVEQQMEEEAPNQISIPAESPEKTSSVHSATFVDPVNNDNNVITDDERGSDDGFADAPESASPSAPRSRSITRMSQSTVSSTAEAPVSDAASAKYPIDRTESRVSIVPVAEDGSASDNGTNTVKSPLSQRRISTSSLDEVSLIDELPPSKESPTPAADTASSVSTSTPSIVDSITNRFSRSSTSSTQTTASMTKSQPPSNTPRKYSTSVAAPSPPPPAPEKPPPPIRRSPFSWLSRSSNSNTPAPPPAPSPPATVTQPNSRRATASSVGTVGSVTTPTNSELLLRRMESNRDVKEKDDVQKGAENLREIFRKLREAAVLEDHAVGNGSKSSLLSGFKSGTLSGQTTSVAPMSPAEDTEPSIAPGPVPPATPPLKSEDDIDWDLWQAVVDDAYKVASEKPTELNRAIQAGIPTTLRGTIWQSMAASKSLELEIMYREVLGLPGTATAEDACPIFGSHWLWDISPSSSRASSPRVATSPILGAKGAALARSGEGPWGKTVAQLEKTIKKDLGDRTSFGKYKVDQKALMGVCKAYALFDPAVGYTQGMTFIATVLLLNMSEEEAFCLFVKLMNKYKLRTMFQEKMKGLELRLFQYDRILEDFEPKVAIHLKRQNIGSSLYAAQWFLTLFTYKFPLQLVLRVFDLLFSEGLEGPILKFGIVLMRKNADALTEMEFEALALFLKERLFDVYLDATPSASSVKEAGFFGNGGEKEVYRANVLIQDACTIKITQEMLDRYEKEWDEQERIKRENELEIEGLRRSNVSLTLKVKKLEEMNEELNREYVRIASSEVALKVQNDQLADENEALNAKVEGLKEIVDKQPREIEDKLKGEMEILMIRNLQVHNENQSLEESMMEMEKELVTAKMQLATVNEDYDALKSRWNDLKKALGD